MFCFSWSDVDKSRQESPSIVVYIVNPFDESSEQVVRRDSYFALLRGFSEMAAGLREKLRSRLVLEVSFLGIISTC